LRISRNRTEYIEYAFGGRGDQAVDGTRRTMTISGDVTGEVGSFEYFCTRGPGLWDGCET